MKKAEVKARRAKDIAEVGSNIRENILPKMEEELLSVVEATGYAQLLEYTPLVIITLGGKKIGLHDITLIEDDTVIKKESEDN